MSAPDGKQVSDQKPRVGVVVPTYCSSAVVGGALASLCSQTYQEWAAVVVDDGSPDAASVGELVCSLRRVHYLSLPHRGAAAARNSGIEFLDVELIAFLDADDEWLPEYLERQLEYLDAHPAMTAVYSDAHLFGEGVSGARLYSQRSPSSGPVTFSSLVSGRCNAITSGMVVRRAAILEVGGFDPSLARAHDFDLWIRLVRRGHQIGYHLQPLVRYRVSSTGLSGDEASVMERERAILAHVAGYPDLTEPERLAVRSALSEAESRVALTSGKQALASRDYQAARRAFQAAWRHHPTRKTGLVRILARLAPGLLRRLAGRHSGTRLPPRAPRAAHRP